MSEFEKRLARNRFVEALEAVAEFESRLLALKLDCDRPIRERKSEAAPLLDRLAAARSGVNRTRRLLDAAFGWEHLTPQVRTWDHLTPKTPKVRTIKNT